MAFYVLKSEKILYLNEISSYGKLCENVSRYTDTSISRWKGIRNEWLKPRTHIHQLSTEDVFEIVKQPKVTEDDKLVPTGLAVLQLSKLLLLRFIYFIEEHLIEGAYRILYLGKISVWIIKLALDVQ